VKTIYKSEHFNSGLFFGVASAEYDFMAWDEINGGTACRQLHNSHTFIPGKAC
jgi:hypothetical protein